MSWDNAVAWVDGLEYYDSVRGVIWTDWRLPTILDGPDVYGWDGTTTRGYNIITSEMGYMYYENLGNLGYRSTDGTYPQPGYGLNNTDLFDNLQSYTYWSGTDYNSNSNYAWYFNFRGGGQFPLTKNNTYNAWAVHDGDIGAVPIPSSIWLLGSGLLGLVGVRRKLRK